jgi:DHA3 family macrolide efflux protein-like MFS transporter
VSDAVPAAWKRNVALFLSGQTVSLFGSMIVQYAAMWYVTLETRSGLAVALYAIAAFAPQGVISLFGGVVADRMNRKVLVIVADASIAAATLVLAFLMLSGVTDLWIVMVAVAVRSVGAGFQQPAVQAMIPQLVPEDQLMRVNGVFQTISSAMALLAPAAAGLVYGVWGIVPVFFIDFVTAVLGIGLLALVPVPTLASIAEKKTGYMEDLVEGMRYIASHAIVRWVLVLFGIIFLLTVAPSFITPLMVARSFGGDVWMLTVLELAFSVGMLLGGILVATLLAKRSRVGLIVVSSFGFGVFTAGLGLSPNLWVFYGFMFLVGLFVPLFSASSMTLLQETVPLDKQGRVFSYFGIIMAVATPIGTAVFGPLADVVAVELLLVAAGVITVVVIVVAVLVPTGRAAMRAVSDHELPGAEAHDSDGRPERADVGA